MTKPRPLVTPTHRFVEVVAHRVCQCPYGVIQHHQVFGLVAVEGGHQHLQDVSQVRYQFRTRLFLQRREGTTGSLLDTLVGVQDTIQQLTHKHTIDMNTNNVALVTIFFWTSCISTDPTSSDPTHLRHERLQVLAV